MTEVSMNINPYDLIKNAQKIQEQMGSFQEKLGSIRVTGSSGGGMVEIDLSGGMEILAVRISPDAMEGGDREMLQDLVAAAYNSAMGKVKEVLSREMGALAGGAFPPGFPS